MECKNCGKETGQIKAEKTREESQKYKCKHCGKVYTPKPKERTYSEKINGRAVGKILGISKNICLYWIKKYAKTLTNKCYPNERVEIIEMDELYSSVEKKTEFT